MKQKTAPLSQDPNKRIELRPGQKGLRVSFCSNQETRTQQQFKDQCDVNNIIAKYKRTGSLTHINNAFTGRYADLSEMPSFHEAQNVVARANELFAEIPALIRDRFAHDPQNLINFLSDEKNHEEAVKLGLMVKRKAPEIPKTEQLLEKLVENTNHTKKTTNTKAKTPPKE